MPSSSREWIRLRKVWLSTTGSPPSTSCGMRGSPLLSTRWRREWRGIEGHQRVQAEQQVQPHVEQHRGVQRLLQRAVDVPAPVDRHRREQPRQRGAGRGRHRDRHVVPARLAEGRGLAAVQVGGHQHQLALELAEVVAAPGRAEHAAHLRFQRRMAEQAGGQRAAQDLEGRQQRAALEQEAQAGLHEQPRQRRRRAARTRPRPGG